MGQTNRAHRTLVLLARVFRAGRQLAAPGAPSLAAAVSLAGAGFPVTIVEREAELGGNLRRLHSTLEVSDVQALLENLARRVESNPLITVVTKRELTDFSGHAGHFTSVVAPVEVGWAGAGSAGASDGAPETIEHGAIVVATGHQEYRPTPNPYPLYGRNPAVLSRLDFERRLVEEGTDWLAGLGRVAFVQCAGSRGEDRPVYVLHRDVRTYGFREDGYREAREKGVVFVRREDGKAPKLTEAADGRPLAAVAESDLTANLLLPVDLVVLSTGAVPSAGAATLANRLKANLNEDGFFMETHAKLAPMDLTSQGIFLCGGAHAPKSISESLLQAEGAAARAATILAKEFLMAGGIVATVDAEKCAACLTCVRVCPFKVPFINERAVAEINPVQCRGCGTCAGECPGQAIHLPGYKDRQMKAAVEALFRVAGD